MKKIIISLGLVATMFATQAQTGTGNFTTNQRMGLSTDSIINTGTKLQGVIVNNSNQAMSVQVDITRLSGTISIVAVGANCVLQGSDNGVNYLTISTDTFKLANTASVQSHIWDFPLEPSQTINPTRTTQPPYYPKGYIAVLCTGKGTTSFRVNSWITGRK